MTKSSVRKAAPRNTHRKTTRKVGVRKAHSGDRKTTSKVATEKARGTYRKTAARFEEFAYDAQMPESMRALAEKSVAQTRELYVHSPEAMQTSYWRRQVGELASQSEEMRTLTTSVTAERRSRRR
jgi:hypothetical protein